MVTTATIDLITYAGAATETKGSTKSGVDDNAFNNVFENINKNYSKTEEHSNNSVNHEKQREVSHEPQKSSQNSEKAGNADKVEEQKSSETSSKEKVTSADDDFKNSDDNNVDDKAQKSDSSENIKKAENSDEQTAEVPNEPSTADVKTSVEIQAAAVEDAVPTVVAEAASENIAEAETETVDSPKTTEGDTTILPELNLSALMEGVFTSLTVANNQTSEVVTVAPTVQAEQSEVALNDVNADLASLTKANVENVVPAQASNIKVQPQTQQAVYNLNVPAQDVEQSNAATHEIEVPMQAAIKSPVIGVATEALASDVNVNTNSVDANTKNLLNKTALTQDVLDKTNAKIMSVETTSSSSSNSNSNNLLSNQNAGEQLIKLSVEGNSSAKGSEILPTADLTQAQSMTFTKALDGVQVQAQAPKELNSSEILSQINSKLSDLQDESTTKVTIVLKPEGLGKINLELVNGKDGLVAKMTTDNAQVKQLLDKNLDSLRETLGSQGVAVNTVSVKVEETQKQSNDMFSFADGQARGENQGSSNNSQSQGENKSNFGSEMEKLFGSHTAGADAEIGDEASSDSYVGQVNYKV